MVYWSNWKRFGRGRGIYILGHERQENEEGARVMNLSKRCNATC